MATTVLKDSYIEMTDYNSGGYHQAYYRCGGLSYDSVTRSGNTVTMTNVKIKSYVQFVRTKGSYFGYTSVYYDWIGIWNNSSTTASGTAPIAKTAQFKNNNPRTRYYDSPHTVRSGDLNIGNVSFTVSGNTAGTKTFKLGLAFGRSNSNSNSNSGRTSGSPAPTFTVSYPANTVKLTVKGSKDGGTATEDTSGCGTFDVTVADRKVKEDTTTYKSDILMGSSYTVNDVKETSANWYYTGSSSYTGTVKAATDVVLPFSSTTVPNGIAATLVSRTFNSIVARGTVTNFGAPVSRKDRYVEVGIAPANVTAYSGVVLKQSAQNTTSTANRTFNQSNDSASLIIAGARSFKVATYATNTKKSTSIVNPTVYWLPPAPLTKVTLIDTVPNKTNVTHTVTITGSASNNVLNITGARVNTQYRWSSNGGTTYTAWTNVATNIAPETTVDATFNVPYAAKILFEARQVTTGDTTQASDVNTLTIPATVPVPPDPSISYAWDKLNRSITITVTGDAGYDSNFASRDLKIHYGQDGYDFVDVNLSTNPSIYVINYPRPNQPMYISARTNNDKGGRSNWFTINTKTRRPIWGVVTVKDENNEDVQHLIRDIVKVHDGSVSTRDWVEDNYTGKKRIVKN